MKINQRLIRRIFFVVPILGLSISCDPINGWIDTRRLDIDKENTPDFIQKNDLLDYPCIPYPRIPENALVTKVIDGDSFVVRMNEGEFEVRYIGINAPEFDEETFNQALSSKRANQELIEGREITLYKDVSNTDRYGRLLRYVFLEDIFINLELVEKGLAQPKSYPPDIACQRLLNSAGEKNE